MESPEQRTGFQISASRHFTEWLASQRTSLAVTTYQSGKVILIGLKPDGRLSAFERTFIRCMGLWSDAQTIWMTSQFQVWRFENVLTGASADNVYDRLYVPQVGFTTGDIDAHDIAVDASNKPVFINTLFSCLATVSDRRSFEPIWKPPFISKLAAEDRCHLNGLAMKDGQPKYVTACSQSDVNDGWRDRRADGGCLVDVETNEIVVSGLSMPHSPRVNGGKLWFLNSGNGDLGVVDTAKGTWEHVAFCPGYARGLAFVGDYAIVGLSRPRHEKTFMGLPLDQELEKRGATSRCGIQVIDTRSGDAVHWLRIEGVVDELYEVAALPGVACPKALGFKTDEIRNQVWFDSDGETTSWSAAN